MRGETAFYDQLFLSYKVIFQETADLVTFTGENFSFCALPKVYISKYRNSGKNFEITTRLPLQYQRI